MKKEHFFLEGLGATTACSLSGLVAGACSGHARQDRKAAATQHQPHLLHAECWFGGVRMAETAKLVRQVELEDGSFDFVIDKQVHPDDRGHEVIAAVKTNHSHFPKAALEGKMAKWLGGSHIVMESTTPDAGVDLVAIGCRHNLKKTVCFVMTKQAGSTVPGSTPHIAKFPDAFGNSMSRRIPRPEIISTHFRHRNCIDVHNHLQQHLLALERHWKTPNPWLRTSMTVIAMAIIDRLRGVRHHCPNLSGMTVEEHADCLACDCIHNRFKSNSLAMTRGHVNAEALDDETTISGGPQAPNLNFTIAGLQDQLRGMLSNVCGGSNPSPLSAANSATGASAASHFVFGVPPSAVPTSCHHHDTMPGRKKNQASGQPALRRCVVCGTNAGNKCTHPRCRARASRDGTLFGVCVCPLNAGMQEGFSKPCLAIHRESEAQFCCCCHLSNACLVDGFVVPIESINRIHCCVQMNAWMDSC